MNRIIRSETEYEAALDQIESLIDKKAAPGTPEGDRVRHAIRRSDNTAFAEARHIFTNSPTTTDRLRHYNGFEVLGRYGDYGEQSFGSSAAKQILVCRTANSSRLIRQP